VPERGRVVAVAARQRGDGGRVTSFSVHPSVVSVEGRDLYVCFNNPVPTNMYVLNMCVIMALYFLQY
jgi:hypothetical protein